MIDARGTAAVALGAVLGATAHWGVIEVSPASTGWPWATFAVNLIGSLLLGVVLAITDHRTDDLTNDPLRLALGTGFCGALTTFSTFAVEVAGLLRDGRSELGVWYLTVSVVVGVAAFVTGRSLARQVVA